MSVNFNLQLARQCLLAIIGQVVNDWVDQEKLRSVVAPFHETQKCLEVEFAIFATHKAIKYILYLPASNQFCPTYQQTVENLTNYAF